MKKTSLKIIFGNNIKYYRFLKKYTQEVLSEKSGLDPRYIRHIESGNGNLPLETIERLAKCLDTDPANLLIEHDISKLPKRVNMMK